MNKRSTTRRRNAGFHVCPAVSTQAKIPDDNLVICTLVASFLCAPSPQFTVVDLTGAVIQLLREKGYEQKAILTALRRMHAAYFAPEETA